MKNIRLNRQLRKAGATRQEARELSDITNDLRDSVPHLDVSVKRQIAQQIGFSQTPIYAKPRFAMVGAFATIMVLSIAAQFAQPSSPLYAIKRATEEVRVILQPSFKDEMQHRRQDEQKQADEQRRIEDTQRDGNDDNSGRGSSSDDTLIDVNESGSGRDRIEDAKIDSSGSGSGEIKIPEVNEDNSVKSIDSSGSGGSSDDRSN
ncbi:hypothetical protein H7X69_00995 [Candidatus Saccharibacteria bacterium]|nr:hypothetical protein [Candidatus Saccharibacteria bacterium]